MFKILHLLFHACAPIIGILTEAVYPADPVHLADLDFCPEFRFCLVFFPDNRTNIGLEKVHNAVLALMGFVFILLFCWLYTFRMVSISFLSI